MEMEIHMLLDSKTLECLEKIQQHGHQLNQKCLDKIQIHGLQHIYISKILLKITTNLEQKQSKLTDKSQTLEVEIPTKLELQLILQTTLMDQRQLDLDKDLTQLETTMFMLLDSDII